MKKAESSQQRYRRLKAQKRCVRCGLGAAVRGRVRCRRCLDRQNELEQQRVARLAAARRCRLCRQPFPSSQESQISCLACREKTRQKRQERVAQGQCRACSAPRLAPHTLCVKHHQAARRTADVVRRRRRWQQQQLLRWLLLLSAYLHLPCRRKEPPP